MTEESLGYRILLNFCWTEIEADLDALGDEELLEIHQTCTREFAIENRLFCEWLEFTSYLRSELKQRGLYKIKNKQHGYI